jgi:hypothetical protein
VAALLCAGALALVASRSVASGGDLIAMLTGLYFVPALINLPEGALFDVIKVNELPIALVRELATGMIAAVLIASALGRLRTATSLPLGSTTWTATGLLWRTVAAVAVFIVCYFAAGAIIYPFVREYYSVRTMPSLGAIASMQVLRALALIVCTYPIVRSIRSPRESRVTMAIVLPVLGGIAPLLPTNALMPPNVRLVHALEMVPYYALFGYLTAMWFGGSTAEEPSPARAAV